MLTLVWLAVASAEEPDPAFRGCDNADAAFVTAYNDAVEVVVSKPEVALRHLERALKHQPGCRAALLLAADTGYRIVDPRGAEWVRAGLRAFPGDADFLVLGSQIAFVGQDFGTALELGTAARKSAPNDLGALQAEQIALLRQGRYDEALAVLDGATQADPAAVACFRVGVYTDLKQYDRAQETMPACKAGPASTADLAAVTAENLASARGEVVGDDPGARGTKLSLEGRYEEALPLYQAAYDAEPWNALARMRLAVCLVQLHHVAKARPHLDALLSAEEWITVYRSGAYAGIITKGGEEALARELQASAGLLVSVLVEQGEVAAAAVALRKAEARFGKTAPLVAAGIVLARAQAPTTAWPAARQALTSFPTSREVLDAVGKLAFADPSGIDPAVIAAASASVDAVFRHNVLAGLANGRRDVECSALAQAYVARPGPDDRPDVRAMGFECAVRAHDVAAADALAVDSSSIDHRVSRAWLHYDAGNIPLAVELAEALVELDESGSAAALLTSAAVKASRADDALRWATHRFGQPGPRYNAAIVLYNAKRPGDAATVLSRVDCAALGKFASDCRALGEAVRAASSPR